MRRFFGYIAVVTAIFAMTLSCRKARVIPKDTLTDMYVEMFLSDQWIVLSGIASQSDTHFVYRPIFEKYGYTADDYRLSVQNYLRDPEDFAKVFSAVEKRLGERIDVLERLDSVRRRQDSAKYADNYRWRNLPKPALYKDVLKGQYPSDTVCFGPDSARYTINIPVLDTMFAGPRLVIRGEGTMDVEKDTVEVSQTDTGRRLDGEVIPIKELVRDDERKVGLRPNRKPQAGSITRRKPVAAGGEAL